MYQSYRLKPNPMLPPVIKRLLFLNIAIFIIQSVTSLEDHLIDWFALWPIGMPEGYSRFSQLNDIPTFQVWQIVSYSFLHGNFMHLFFNMFALWMFGIQIEQLWGARRITVYYFVCVIGAAIIQLIVNGVPESIEEYVPTIGASGGVFGILLAFGMMFPNQRLFLLFPPIPVKAKWVVIAYGVLELLLGVTGTQTTVAHFAHLGGMLFGLLLIQYWRGRFPFR